MTTVTLYKNAKVNGTTRCSAFTSLASQRNYFNGLTKKTFNIQTFTLGEPIKLNDSIANLTDYGYLSIDYGDGFRYYAYVSDFEFLTTNQSRLIYVIDSYETAYLQTNMTFGRCNVYRANVDLESYGLKEVTGTEPYSKEYIKVQSFPHIGLYYTRRDSNTNKVYFGYMSMDDGLLIPKIANGGWIAEILGVAESDIWIAGVLPAKPSTLVLEVMTHNTKVIDNITYDYYESDSGSLAKMEIEQAEFPIIGTDVYEEYIIRDLRGNTVYTFRPYQQILAGACIGFIVFNASSISLKYIVSYSNADVDYVTIPSELIDVYVDSWKEYYYRQRESDLQARKQQVSEGAVSGLAGVGISTASGLGLGFMMGGPVGAGIGAVAGLALGVLGVGINSGIQSYYNNQSQKSTDRVYQLANDTLNQTGNFSEIYSEQKLAGIWRTKWDDISKAYTESEIANNGKFLVGCTNSIEFLPKGAFQGECEILGDIPNNWKLQIQQRLLQGVMVV